LISSSLISKRSKVRLVAALLEKRRRQVRPAAGLDLLTWMVLHRRKLQPGVPLDMARHRYLVDIYNETAQRVVLYKAGQMGVSEYLVSYALHAADQRQATPLYVFPTESDVSDFSSARIGPAIEASPYLSSIIIEGAAIGGKRGADRVTLKRVGDRFLYLRGGKVDPDGTATQLKSIAADVLILDEVDEMDPRAPAIAEKRLGHSDIAEVREASTPTYSGRGIHAGWLKSDQREWHVRCAHCGEWQSLSINQVVVEWDQLGRPVRWHGQAESRAWVACRKCGREVDRVSAGQWIAARPGVDIAGYHLTKLFSPATSLLDVVKALDTVDETRRKEAFNQDLGEPYTPRGGKLTETMLDDCRREYAHGPRKGLACWMGVDVGKMLHVVIRSFDPEAGERPQIWAGGIESWKELGHTVQRFNPTVIVIDALPETTKAREFQAGFASGRVWLAYYTQQKVGTKHIEPQQWSWDDGVVNLDRTRTLDEMFADVVAGVATLPAHARDIRDYYDHLQAPVRVLEAGAGGIQVPRYVESGPDHFAHAENYARVAVSAPRGERTASAESHVVSAQDLFGG